jgi:hypothetical protein
VKLKPVVAVLLGILTIVSMVITPLYMHWTNRIDEFTSRVESLEKENIAQKMCLDNINNKMALYDKSLEEIRYIREDLIKVKIALGIKD